MSRAVGGYVRRCERKPYYEPRRLGMPRFELFYQSMPVLSFVPFDVSEPIDKPGMDTIASVYEQFQGHHPAGS